MIILNSMSRTMDHLVELILEIQPARFPSGGGDIRIIEKEV